MTQDIVAVRIGRRGWLPELSRVLRPTTERLLRAAGVREGMTVLDIYSGHGDVTMLAADVVGDRGRVLGIDPCGEAIEQARARATTAGYRNISYRQVDVDNADLSASFDVAVCRHVVMGHPSPAHFLKSAARTVRPGGVLAMHEMNLSRGIRSSPPLPTLQVINRAVHDALERSGVLIDAGGRLVDLLDEAELPSPQLFSESFVGSGGEPSIFALVEATVRSLEPLLSVEERAAMNLDALQENLRRAATWLRSQVEFYPQVCAWTRVGVDIQG
jgi:SAM-dependent methyltransferase